MSVNSSKTTISVLVYALTSQGATAVNAQKDIALELMEERVRVSKACLGLKLPCVIYISWIWLQICVYYLK